MLRQALQLSRETLREEARRAGAAEALLRERTAALVAAARWPSGSHSPSISEQEEREARAELRRARLDRDRLAEMLQSMEHSAAGLKKKVEDTNNAAEGQRSRRAASAQQCLHIQQEIKQAQSERMQLVEAAARDSESLFMQRAEFDKLASQMDGLRGEMTWVQQALETERAHAGRLLQERHDLEVTFQSYQEHAGTSDQQQLGVISKLEVAVEKLSGQVHVAETELGAQQGSAAELESANKALQQRLAEAEFERIKLHNQIQELKGNLRVYCRVRPVADDDADICLHTQDPDKLCVSRGCDGFYFSLDRVFGPHSGQGEIFNEMADIVQSSMDGYKVGIIAFGHAASGKTYALQGADGPGCAGLIPRALMKICRLTQGMRTKGWTWSLQVSVMELCNENLRDLLRGTGDAAAGPTDGHTVAPHELWGALATGVSSVDVDSVEQVAPLLARATHQRSAGTSGGSSHFIFVLFTKGTNTVLGKELHGSLSMVELAAGERLGRRREPSEAHPLNKSISTLFDILVAKPEGRTHVPFRNSKLTQLLEPCLTGQGKTLLLSTVTADRGSTEETLSTLRMAGRVARCAGGPSNGPSGRRRCSWLGPPIRQPVESEEQGLDGDNTSEPACVDESCSNSNARTPRSVSPFAAASAAAAAAAAAAAVAAAAVASTTSAPAARRAASSRRFELVERRRTIGLGSRGTLPVADAVVGPAGGGGSVQSPGRNRRSGPRLQVPPLPRGNLTRSPPLSARRTAR